MTLLLSACPMRDWIKSDEDKISVEEFKRITEVVGDKDKSQRQKIEQELKETEIFQLFYLLSQYRSVNSVEQKVLFRKIERDFKHNPTLFNALFLSMIQVTIRPGETNLAVNSNLMKAIDMSSADPSLIELLKVFKALRKIEAQKQQLETKLKLSEAENIKNQKNVAELTSQINALKKIEESIYKRELVLDIQE